MNTETLPMLAVLLPEKPYRLPINYTAYITALVLAALCAFQVCMPVVFDHLR